MMVNSVLKLAGRLVAVDKKSNMEDCFVIETHGVDGA